MRKFFQRLFSSSYTRHLESELARTRAENRALINSILSIAGLPPLRLEAELQREAAREKPSTASTLPGDSEARRNSHPPQLSRTAQSILLPPNPHRRRSWQQINRQLELEERRKITNRDNSEIVQAPQQP